jgi:dolichol-phosphate mannosyltransferase
MIVVVDDYEPMQSRKLKVKLEHEFTNIQVHSRGKKSGRGSAVLHGLRSALKNKKIQYFIEMDADFSHSPKEISLFLDTTHQFDCIVGSRYLSGSSIVRWPMYRRVLSILINSLLRRILNINVSDFTNGFRQYSRRAAEYLVSRNLRETGFIALSEWLVVLKKGNFSVGEVPTTFTDREYGKSSAGICEHLNAIRGLLRIISRYYFRSES